MHCASMISMNCEGILVILPRTLKTVVLRGISASAYEKIATKIIFPRKPLLEWLKIAGCGGEDWKYRDPERGRTLNLKEVLVNHEQLLET